MNELNELFSSLPSEKPIPTRYLRSQRPKQACDDFEGLEADKSNKIKSEATCEVDVDDLIPEFDVLAGIQNNYWKQIVS